MSTPKISVVCYKMNSKKSCSANKVSTLIQRYEELVKTKNIRPFLRRWVSANSTNIDTANSRSALAQRLDKVAIPINKPTGAGLQKDLDIRTTQDDSIGSMEGKVNVAVENKEENSKSISRVDSIKSRTSRKNAKISTSKFEPLKFKDVEHSKKNNNIPLNAAHSIEDFEELIYFNEANEEVFNPQYEPKPENIPDDLVELARKRAKAEEEKYRKSFVDEEEDNEPILQEECSNIQNNNLKNENSEPIVGKKDKKEFVVDELISTERIYIENLELVIKHYLQYMKQQHYDSDTIKIVFSNIESIHEHSQLFLLDLQNCNYNYAEIGKVFCKHRELFDRYPKYCKERSRSHILITTDLKEIVAHLQLKLKDKLGLNSSLLKPIQRLAKYELFLINLNKLLLEQGLDVTSLQNAITLIQRTARIADTMVILNKIESCPYNYNDIGRLILQNEFRLLTPEKIETVVFLFGKMLIFTEQTMSKEKFNYRYSIPNDALRFNRPKDGSILILENFNKPRKLTFTLETKDTKVLNVWFKEIHQILWKQLEICKGTAQREAFTSSLNHFKKRDTVERRTSSSINQRTNKKSLEDDKQNRHIIKKETQLSKKTDNKEMQSNLTHCSNNKYTQKKHLKTSDNEKIRKKNLDKRMAIINRM